MTIDARRLGTANLASTQAQRHVDGPAPAAVPPAAPGSSGTNAATARADAASNADVGATRKARAVVGDVATAAAPHHSAGAASSRLGFALFGRPVSDIVRQAVRSTMVALAVVGAAGALTPAQADTVFLDHNNAPMEIKVAKQLAAEIGEKFVLVRPDAQSLDAVFARAERGEIDMRHLILSGHSSGQHVWGEGEGGTRHETSIEQFKELKAKYPKAFAQVKHVHFMSCYAGSAGNSAAWSAVFPNAKAIAGFWGIGPSKIQLASQLMLQNSERHLRTLDARKLTPQQALVEAKRMAQMDGAKVTKFAVRLDGTHFALGAPTTPLDQLHDRVDLLGARAFEPFMNPVGQTADFQNTPRNHAQNPLRDYYNALQSYLGALPTGSHEATATQARIETTIRLIYFDGISARMQQQHGAVLAQANADLAAAGLGRIIPSDLGRATRLQIVEAANTLEQMRIPQPSGAVAKARELLIDGLRDLKPSIIPATWID